jgi:hypothetical protein
VSKVQVCLLLKAYGTCSLLGGVMVSVLVIGPKVCGFKPGGGDGFLREIKIRSTPSFGVVM